MGQHEARLFRRVERRSVARRNVEDTSLPLRRTLEAGVRVESLMKRLRGRVGVSVDEHRLHAEKTTEFASRAHQADAVRGVESVVRWWKGEGHRSKKKRIRSDEKGVSDGKKRGGGAVRTDY